MTYTYYTDNKWLKLLPRHPSYDNLIALYKKFREIQDHRGVSSVTITSSQDQPGITTKLWRNYPE